MIPKKIHLCWFGGKDYPVATKLCLETWLRLMPDYEIRLWNERDARAIGCQYVDQALDRGRPAYAADAVRFYAIWKEGGIYMDSDIYLYRRPDRYVPDHGMALFGEPLGDGATGLQPALLIGEKGNYYAERVYGHYAHRPFVRRDGTEDLRGAAEVMAEVASSMGFRGAVESGGGMLLDRDTVVYPCGVVTPSAGVAGEPGALACHRSHNRGGRRPGPLHMLRRLWLRVGFALTHAGSRRQWPPFR